MLRQLKEFKPQILVLVRFGSHLYGTNTIESDIDYKGVFLPTKEMICLGKIPKSFNFNTNKLNSKNTKEDVDIELYSLHYFIELACKGETIALDMLHVNKGNLIETSLTWNSIVKHRRSFLTKNLRSFVGYARKQAAKYGVKGNRLNVAKDFLNILSSQNEENKLNSVVLPITEHSKFIEDSPNGIPQYQICGKILQTSITINKAVEIMNSFVTKYGERAKKAANNEGVDWKAVSHALRAAFQMKQILDKGNSVSFKRS